MGPDHPGGRKTHAAPVPLVGGLGMFLACVAMIPFTDLPTHVIWAWLAGAGLIFGVGLADDVRDLSALPRFGVQVAAALVMALAAKALEFEKAAALRDRIRELRSREFGLR